MRVGGLPPLVRQNLPGVVFVVAREAGSGCAMWLRVTRRGSVLLQNLR